MVEEVFQFGTSAEVNQKTEAKAKQDQLEADGLFNPSFFGNQEKRENRYLSNLFQFRQNVLKNSRVRT